MIYIYHYCATVQHCGSTYSIDGIARLSGSIETMQCYTNFKKLVEDNNENLRDGIFIITSLSFLGTGT
jgi:hypothetical protein